MITIKNRMFLDDGTIIKEPIKKEPIKDGEVDECESIEEATTTTKPNNKPKHK